MGIGSRLGGRAFNLAGVVLAGVAVVAVTAGMTSRELHAQRPPRGRTLQPIAGAGYFPLEVGNFWIFRFTGFAASGTQTARVAAAKDVGDQRYFLLEGFTPEPAWVRMNAGGEMVELDAVSGGEKLWYDFSAPAGASWMSHLPVECVETASMFSRNAREATPAGVFRKALSIRYSGGNCSDAGIIEEVFAPGLGPIRRTMQTIGGPRTMVLAEASVGAAALPGDRVSLSLSVDQPVYFPNLMPPVDPARTVPVMKVKLAIGNSTNFPLKLSFLSGQQFDMVIRDEGGRQVYQWSLDKLFTMALTELDLSPGEKAFFVEIRLEEASAALLPGAYTLEAWLTTDPIRYRTTVGFEMGEPVF